MLSDGGRDAATNLSCINYAHQAKVDLRDHGLIITIIITIIIIINNRPKPDYGRQGLAGSWGEETDQAGTFWSVLNCEKAGVGHLPGGHFTTPKIRTFDTPKFGHSPPPKNRKFARRTTATPSFF